MSEPTTPDVPATPEPATPEAPPPATPEAAAPKSLEERLAKAEAAAQRRKEQATARQRELDEIRGKYQAVEAEKGTLAQQLQKFKELQERARTGDDDAITELAGISFDDWTRLKLEPESARRDLQGKGQQTELQKELEAIKAKLQEREAAEEARAFEEEKRSFVAVVDQMRGDSPDLQALDNGSLLQLAGQFAPALAKEYGRNPTFAELATAIADAVRPYHERIYTAYSKRQAAPPPPAPKLAPKGREPTTITAKEATTSATEKRPQSPEEIREAAIRKAKELMSA